MHWAVISIQMLYEFWSIITYAIVYATLIYGVIGSTNSWVSSGESGFKGELNSDYVHCCRELLSASSTAAIIGSCVFHAAAAAEQKAFHDAYTAQGPLLRVLMVTYATNGLIEYSAYSTAVNAAYAQYNGYTFRALNESSLQQVIEDKDLFSKPADVDERWFKVKILEHTIANSDADYVVWLDADLIVTRFEVRVEQIMASHPNAYIILCAEHAGSSTRVNSGSIMVKNTEWTLHFLREWWADAETRMLYSDQEQFDIVLTRMFKGASKKQQRLIQQRIVILTPNAFNSDPPAMTQQLPTDPVLHLMGEHLSYRRQVFRRGFTAVCEAIEPPPLKPPQTSAAAPYSGDHESSSRLIFRKLPPQLGLTREWLHYMSIQIYGPEAAALLLEYLRSLSRRAAGDISAESEIGLTNSQQLSNAVHHFAYALESAPSVAAQSSSSQVVGTHWQHHRTLEEIWQLFEGSDDFSMHAFLTHDALRWSAARLRVITYEALRRSALLQMQTQRQQQQRSDEPLKLIPRDWPEMLKAVTVAGQNVLTLPMRSAPGQLHLLHEKCSVARCMAAMLREMFEICHPQQRDAVLLMLAHLHAQVGQLNTFVFLTKPFQSHNAACELPPPPPFYIFPGAAGTLVAADSASNSAYMNICAAAAPAGLRAAAEHDGFDLSKAPDFVLLANFENSLQLTRRVAHSAGEHLLPMPLMQLASALSLHHKYDEAINLYEEAVFIKRRALNDGTPEGSITTLLLNYAMALTNSARPKNCERARHLLSEVEALLCAPEKQNENLCFITEPLANELANYTQLSEACSEKYENESAPS